MAIAMNEQVADDVQLVRETLLAASFCAPFSMQVDDLEGIVRTRYRSPGTAAGWTLARERVDFIATCENNPARMHVLFVC